MEARAKMETAMVIAVVEGCRNLEIVACSDVGKMEEGGRAREGW